MKTIVIIILLIAALFQDIKIRWLEEEVETIKSWYPFCELMKFNPKDDDE